MLYELVVPYYLITCFVLTLPYSLRCQQCCSSRTTMVRMSSRGYCCSRWRASRWAERTLHAHCMHMHVHMHMHMHRYTCIGTACTLRAHCMHMHMHRCTCIGTACTLRALRAHGARAACALHDAGDGRAADHGYATADRRVARVYRVPCHLPPLPPLLPSRALVAPPGWTRANRLAGGDGGTGHVPTARL